MKTHQENKKTNEQPNVKAYLQRFIILMVTIMVSTALAGCDILNNGDDPDDVNGGNGKGRELNANEKELVGKYSYGSSGSGYWTYYSYNYDQWKDAFTYASGIWFKSDGTFEGFGFAYGSGFIRGGSLVKITAKWQIPVKGTVRFSDYVESTRYNDGTTRTWKQSENPDWNPNFEYILGESSGKKGVYFGWSYGTPDTFHEKE